MGTSINFIKQLEERRKAGLDGVVEESEDDGNIGTKIRNMVGTSSTGKPEPRDIVFFVFSMIVIVAFQMKDQILEDYFRRDKMQQVENELSQIDSKLQIQNQKLLGYEGVKSQIEAYDRQEREFNEKLSLIKSVRIGRNSTVRMVDYIVKKMPLGVWLNIIDLSIPGATNGGQTTSEQLGSIKIEGFSKSHQEVSQYLSQLEGTSFFPVWNLKFTDVGNYELSESTAGTAASKDKLDAKKFEINATVVQL